MAAMTNDTNGGAELGTGLAVRDRLGNGVRALRLARPRPARRRLVGGRGRPGPPLDRRARRRAVRRPGTARSLGRTARSTSASSLLFGALPVAGAQFGYFSAVQRMDVGPALLIEYTAPAAVVVWLWLRHGERPGPLTVAGAGLAAIGLVLVLDLLSGADLAPLGVFWALFAMVGAASYFVLAAKPRDGLPPVALAGVGLTAGALVLAALGVVGLLPMDATTASPVYPSATSPGGSRSSGWRGHRRLRLLHRDRREPASRLAPVLLRRAARGRRRCAFAWPLLDQLPGPLQLAGGVLILAGVIVVKLGERPRTPRPTTITTLKPVTETYFPPPRLVSSGAAARPSMRGATGVPSRVGRKEKRSRSSIAKPHAASVFSVSRVVRQPPNKRGQKVGPAVAGALSGARCERSRARRSEVRPQVAGPASPPRARDADRQHCITPRRTPRRPPTRPAAGCARRRRRVPARVLAHSWLPAPLAHAKPARARSR